MKLEEIYKYLILDGYPPEEVEYVILEVLQYKRPNSLSDADLRILINMLQEKNRRVGSADTGWFSLTNKLWAI